VASLQLRPQAPRHRCDHRTTALLCVITPDYVHVMAGRTDSCAHGGKEAGLELEERGYDWVDQELAVLRGG